MATRYESVKHPLCSMTIPVAIASLFFLQDKKDANSRLMSKQHVFIFQPDNSLIGFVASLVFQQWQMDFSHHASRTAPAICFNGCQG